MPIARVPKILICRRAGSASSSALGAQKENRYRGDVYYRNCLRETRAAAAARNHFALSSILKESGLAIGYSRHVAHISCGVKLNLESSEEAT